jgi:hypothetical protein
MNKTLLFVVFATLAALGLAGYVVVLLVSPENATAFVGTLVTILAIVSASATTFYMLGKQQDTLEQVKTQTNGANTALREENASLRNQLLAVVAQAPSKDLTEPAKVD